MADYSAIRQEYVDNKGSTDVIDDYRTGFMTREEYDSMLDEMFSGDTDEERRREVRDKLSAERDWYEAFELMQNDREKDYQRQIDDLKETHRKEIERMQRDAVRSFINRSGRIREDSADVADKNQKIEEAREITSYDDLWREEE